MMINIGIILFMVSIIFFGIGIKSELNKKLNAPKDWCIGIGKINIGKDISFTDDDGNIIPFIEVLIKKEIKND